MTLKDELKTLRAGLEQALTGAAAALEILHVNGDPTSGPTELQRDRLEHIAFVLSGMLGQGADLDVVEDAQAGRSKMP